MITVACRLDWPVRTLSFSYDGRMLASASEDLLIDIADVESGERHVMCCEMASSYFVCQQLILVIFMFLSNIFMSLMCTYFSSLYSVCGRRLCRRENSGRSVRKSDVHSSVASKAPPAGVCM